MSWTKEYEIGTFDLGTEVDITDPCYDKGVWCRMTTECQPGTYTGYAYISDEGEWGERVAEISIFKDDIKCETEDMELIGNIGVDAGLAGFFNNKPNYPDDKWMEFLVNAGVFKSYDEYDYDKNYYCVDYGVFSSSGYGDGGYDVYANEDRTAFTIVFIEEDEDEGDE